MRRDNASLGHLGDLEEFRHPSHPCEESLVDLQPIFTLAPLHLEKLLCVAEMIEGSGRKSDHSGYQGGPHHSMFQYYNLLNDLQLVHPLFQNKYLLRDQLPTNNRELQSKNAVSLCIFFRSTTP